MRSVARTLSLLTLALLTLEGSAFAEQAAPPPDSGWSAEAPPPPPPAPAAPPAAPAPPPSAPPAASIPPPEASTAPPPPTAAPAPRPAPAPPPKKGSEYDGPPLLFGKKKTHVGGYGGPMIAYSHMLRKDGVLFGGEGAVLIDHRLSLGLAGYGFSRTPTAPPRVDGTPREFATGYGGVLFRYHAYADFPVYGSVGVLLGGGALSVYPEQQSDGDEWEGDSDDARGYFVAQPDISLHVNVVRWLRFGLTFGYRFATAVDEYWYQASEMGGVLAGGNVQGGWL